MRKFFTIIISFFGILVILYSAITIYFHFKYPQTKWDWSKIDPEDISFPEKFLWGTATAAHQVEGDNENSNWGHWEKQKDENGKARIHNGDVSGRAANQWELYEKDIELMKELGANSYRFSLAWSKIQPAKDEFNEVALKHYDEVIDALLENDLEPMITLHHFTHPQWFEEFGAFEKEENIKYFVEFSKKVFARYQDRVKYWVTFNEPNVFITGGYFNTHFPPGTHDPELSGLVFENILKAHVQTYKELKSGQWSVVGGQKKEDSVLSTQHPVPETQIGIVQSTFQFEPYRRWHLGDWAIARISSNVFNETTLSFFRTGTMKYYLPFQASRTYTDLNAPNTLDFIGLNYYSHHAYKFNFDFRKATNSLPIEGEEMTDMPYTIYTEGIYRAIEEVATLNKPIIITENGIADAKDTKRGKYIKQSLYAVSKAIKDGYDIRGFYYWSLIDNFEWAEGYSMKFGLYEVDFKTQERRLREGSRAYIEIIKKHKK